MTTPPYQPGYPAGVSDKSKIVAGILGILLFVCLVPTVVFGVFWQPLARLAAWSVGVNVVQSARPARDSR